MGFFYVLFCESVPLWDGLAFISEREKHWFWRWAMALNRAIVAFLAMMCLVQQALLWGWFVYDQFFASASISQGWFWTYWTSEATSASFWLLQLLHGKFCHWAFDERYHLIKLADPPASPGALSDEKTGADAFDSEGQQKLEGE